MHRAKWIEVDLVRLDCDNDTPAYHFCHVIAQSFGHCI